MRTLGGNVSMARLLPLLRAVESAIPWRKTPQAEPGDHWSRPPRTRLQWTADQPPWGASSVLSRERERTPVTLPPTSALSSAPAHDEAGLPKKPTCSGAVRGPARTLPRVDHSCANSSPLPTKLLATVRVSCPADRP